MSNTPRREDRTDEVRLWREGSAWVARDVGTGVASQGTARGEALEMLDEAVALHHGEIGRPARDGDRAESGIDVETAPADPRVPDTPWFDRP